MDFKCLAQGKRSVKMSYQGTLWHWVKSFSLDCLVAQWGLSSPSLAVARWMLGNSLAGYLEGVQN